MLEATETTEVLLTHPLVPSGPIPTAYDPHGVYPYESYCETSQRPVMKKYRMRPSKPMVDGPAERG
jgi:hypothetical protein